MNIKRRLEKTMPGMAHHILFGRMAFQQIHNHFGNRFGQQLDKTKFMMGNLLPDMAANKTVAHCYARLGEDGSFLSYGLENTNKYFHIPDLKKARDLYVSVDDISVRLGVLAHLYLDSAFVRKVLVPRVKILPTGEVSYTIEERRFTMILGDTLERVTRVAPEQTITITNKQFRSLKGIKAFYDADLMATLVSYLVYNPKIEGGFDLDYHVCATEQKAKRAIKRIKAVIPREIPAVGYPLLDERELDDWYEFLEKRLEESARVSYMFRSETGMEYFMNHGEMLDFLMDTAWAFDRMALEEYHRYITR